MRHLGTHSALLAVVAVLAGLFLVTPATAASTVPSSAGSAGVGAFAVAALVGLLAAGVKASRPRRGVGWTTGRRARVGRASRRWP